MMSLGQTTQHSPSQQCHESHSFQNIFTLNRCDFPLKHSLDFSRVSTSDTRDLSIRKNWTVSLCVPRVKYYIVPFSLVRRRVTFLWTVSENVSRAIVYADIYVDENVKLTFTQPLMNDWLYFLTFTFSSSWDAFTVMLFIISSNVSETVLFEQVESST